MPVLGTTGDDARTSEGREVCEPLRVSVLGESADKGSMVVSRAGSARYDCSCPHAARMKPVGRGCMASGINKPGPVRNTTFISRVSAVLPLYLSLKLKVRRERKRNII